MVLKHAGMGCGACHVAQNPGLLHLADGAKLAMADSMQLCSQCHGSQRRAFEHGAHGGMRGYWDTRLGPRLRNHCVSCHPAHQPKYQQVMPVAGPRQ